MVNQRILVDTGWQGALRMVELGLDPLKVEALILTHGHQDHYLGLPMFLFYRGMLSLWGEKPAPLTVLGPEDEVGLLVDLTRGLLTKGGRAMETWIEPAVVPLGPGQTVEAAGCELRAVRALHPVPALSYRLEDRDTGSVLCFTGDTEPNPELVDLAKGADLLIHEATFVSLPESGQTYGHSSAETAAQVAAEAGARRLLMIHYDESKSEELLAAARKVFPRSDLARDGETVTLE